MRTLRFLLEKEFHQMFRNRAVLRMIFVSPVIQLLILPLAANYEVKNINLAIVDRDQSSYSQKFISKVLSSGYFRLSGYNKSSYPIAFNLIEEDKADIVLEIPKDFESNLVRDGKQKIFLAVNAINGVKALMGSGYLNSIINDFNGEVRSVLIPPQIFNPLPAIEVVSSNWFNPHLAYYMFMVPGILVMLLTLVGGNMAAMNIVKEKESGTIEQINVTPIKKYIFILGKLIPFWVLGVAVFSMGLLIAWSVYGIVPLGNIFLLYLFMAIYLVAMLGFGLLISTYSETQQQAHSLTFFFIMIFNLMSGLYTSIDSMPHWAQVITYFIPIKYFIEVCRMVILKGSGFHDISFNLLIVLLMGIVLNGWAIFNYKKTT